MSKQNADLAAFEATYREHVAMVVAGDQAGVLADMFPEALPTVFDDVVVPRGGVVSAEVLDVRLDGSRGVGRAVYTTHGGTVALRSGWVHDGTAWKADTLENFDPSEGVSESADPRASAS